MPNHLVDGIWLHCLVSVSLIPVWTLSSHWFPNEPMGFCEWVKNYYIIRSSIINDFGIFLNKANPASCPPVQRDMKVALLLFASMWDVDIAKLLKLGLRDISIRHKRWVNELPLRKLNKISRIFPMLIHWLQILSHNMAQHFSSEIKPLITYGLSQKFWQNMPVVILSFFVIRMV